MTTTLPVEDRTTLVTRTAFEIYQAEVGGKESEPFATLHPVEIAKYERMAKAALTVAYLEPVTA